MKNAEILAAIAAGLDAELATLGFVPEARPFEPHLTMLRIKARPPEALLELLVDWAETDFGICPVGSIELIRSELRPEGSRYTILATARLSGAL